MTLLIATLLCAAAYALRWWSEDTVLTPDGRFYLAYGKGEGVPRPYCCRPLLPKLLGGSEKAWRVVSAISLILCGPALVGYLAALGAIFWQSLAGVGLFIGLSGVWRLNVRFPVLVDQCALLLAITGAWAMLEGLWWVVIPLALLGGLTKETVPVWMAVFSWSPLPLVGLLPAAGLYWYYRHHPVPEDASWARPWLDHPLRAARAAHRGLWFDPKIMLYPWGAVFILALLSWNIIPLWLALALVVALVLSYAQLLVANDTARLYQWAAPLAIAAAIYSLPETLAPLVVVAHIFNPYQADI